MKNQVLFSSEDKSKKLKCHLLQFLFGALRLTVANSAQGDQIHVISVWLHIPCSVCHNIFCTWNF